MSGEGKCSGTCVFHEQYEENLKTVYDWHLGAKERENTMQESIKTMTTWFRRLVFSIVTGIGIQVAVLIVKAGAR